MGLLGNGQADVKSIEMNNRAFKKIDLNHVFVCFFFRKVWRFVCRSFGEVSICSMCFSFEVFARDLYPSI